MMNFNFTLLVLIAIAISVVIILVLFLWLMGVDALALPGLGIIVATPLLLCLLIICESRCGGGRRCCRAIQNTGSDNLLCALNKRARASSPYRSSWKALV